MKPHPTYMNYYTINIIKTKPIYKLFNSIFYAKKNLISKKRNSVIKFLKRIAIKLLVLAIKKMTLNSLELNVQSK